MWNSAVGIPLFIIGAIALVLIYRFGQPKKPDQGDRRFSRVIRRGGSERSNSETERVEPTFGSPGAAPDASAGGEMGTSLHNKQQIDRLSEMIAADREGTTATPAPVSVPPRPLVGARPDHLIERIVTLYVAARNGSALNVADVVIAAEKAGLEFGAMGIFHRLALGKKSEGPVFSMANMVKPGSFDMTQIDTAHTPGVTLFMTLPGPLAALDAWETMLPTAQRLAKLLDAQVLDEDRNALGRQRVAHIRDELRAWDRQQERNQIKPER